MQHRTPEVIPDTLLEAPTAAKYLYLYLVGKGIVSFSTRDMARSLGLSQPTIRTAFEAIQDAGAVVFEEEPRERVKPIFRVLTREEVQNMGQISSPTPRYMENWAKS